MDLFAAVMFGIFILLNFIVHYMHMKKILALESKVEYLLENYFK